MSETNEADRCMVCGWPLSDRIRDGCTTDSCALRPRPEVTYAEKLRGDPLAMPVDFRQILSERDARIAELESERAALIEARRISDEALVAATDKVRALEAELVEYTELLNTINPTLDEADKELTKAAVTMSLLGTRITELEAQLADERRQWQALVDRV